MESELIIAAPKLIDSYPCLKQEAYKGLYVVLFVGRGKGIVVHTEEGSSWSLGTYSEDWAESCFKALPEGSQITIIQ